MKLPMFKKGRGKRGSVKQGIHYYVFQNDRFLYNYLMELIVFILVLILTRLGDIITSHHFLHQIFYREVTLMNEVFEKKNFQKEVDFDETK